MERAGTNAPAEDFQEKIAKLKQQFDPASVEVAIEPRQANEILRKASAYFAQAELDRPFRR